MNLLNYIREKFHPLWRIRRTKWLHKILCSIDFQFGFWDKYTGYKIYIYWYRDFPFLLSKSYIFEKEVRDAMLLILKYENISKFWDVGGNIGYYSFLISRLLPESEIVAFEPYKKNLELFKRSITRNKITNINLVCKAVSNKTGYERFLTDDVSGSTGQFYSLLRPNDEYQISNAYGLNSAIYVETIKLDDLIHNDHEIPDFMKVDIEEAEELMFQGARKLINCKKTIIVIETYNIKVLRLFKKNDYLIFLLDDASNYVFIPNTKEQLISIFRKNYNEIQE